MSSADDLAALRALTRSEREVGEGLDDYCLLEDGAVLLCSPLSDAPTRVVGADLRDVLGLLLLGNGAQIGGLAHDWEETVDELDHGPDAEELSDSERRALARLVDVLGLRRWTDTRARLGELQTVLPPFIT